MSKDAVLRLPLAPARPKPRFWQSAVRFWQKNATPAVTLSIIALVLCVTLVLVADVIAPYNPTAINLRNRLVPPFASTVPDSFLLGTDATGRDLFSRVLYGGQISLAVAALSTGIGLVLGVLLGILSGYLRGPVDTIIMYLVDVQLSLPFVLLAVAVALVLGTSPVVLIGLAALSTWPVYTRVVRGAVLSLREREFIIAAQALGATRLQIMLAHLLPNLVAPIVVLATLSIGRVILLESSLSFLGIGIQPPTPSWGGMINEGRDYLSTAWWIATVPGLALVIVTMAIGTIGDWLSDLVDVASA
jgi:peptide/nickel transport system permease protein